MIIQIVQNLIDDRGWCRTGAWAERSPLQASLWGCNAGSGRARPGCSVTGPPPYSSFTILKTTFHVIIHHAGCLHVRVADRGSDKLEAALLQVLGQGGGFR